MPKEIQYEYHPDNLKLSDPNVISQDEIQGHEMVLNVGPPHPSTHGVLRLEVLSDG